MAEGKEYKIRWDDKGDTEGWYVEVHSGGKLLDQSQSISFDVDVDGFKKSQKQALVRALKRAYEEVDMSFYKRVEEMDLSEKVMATGAEDAAQATGNSDGFLARILAMRTGPTKIKPAGSDWEYDDTVVRGDVNHGEVPLRMMADDGADARIPVTVRREDCEATVDDILESLENL